MMIESPLAQAFKLNIDILTQQEMQETEGSYGWWSAAAGFTSVAVAYGSYTYGSGSWSLSGFGRAAAIGAFSVFALPTR